MTLKFLVIQIFLGYSIAANAAFTQCEYVKMPCDDYGNHFFCQIIGWTGPNPPQYCSPNNQSTFPGEKRDSILDDANATESYTQNSSLEMQSPGDKSEPSGVSGDDGTHPISAHQIFANSRCVVAVASPIHKLAETVSSRVLVGLVMPAVDISRIYRFTACPGKHGPLLTLMGATASPVPSSMTAIP